VGSPDIFPARSDCCKLVHSAIQASGALAARVK
jgi:hypothetical protein